MRNRNNIQSIYEDEKLQEFIRKYPVYYGYLKVFCRGIIDTETKLLKEIGKMSEIRLEENNEVCKKYPYYSKSIYEYLKAHNIPH